MEKNYVTPNFTVNYFEISDVITTSGTGGDGPIELPDVTFFYN